MQHEELAEVGAGVETPPEGVGAELGVEAEVGAGVEPEAVVLDVTEHPSAQMPDVVLNRPRTLPYPALATFATSPHSQRGRGPWWCLQGTPSQCRRCLSHKQWRLR